MQGRGGDHIDMYTLSVYALSFSPVYLYFTLPLPPPPPSSLPQGVSYAYTDNREVVYPFPYVTTVFSASNYCGSYGNKGAVMIFYPDDIQVSLYM